MSVQRNKHGDKPGHFPKRAPKRCKNTSKRNRAADCLYDSVYKVMPDRDVRISDMYNVEPPETNAWKNSPERWSGNYGRIQRRK